MEKKVKKERIFEDAIMIIKPHLLIAAGDSCQLKHQQQRRRTGVAAVRSFIGLKWCFLVTNQCPWISLCPV